MWMTLTYFQVKYYKTSTCGREIQMKHRYICGFKRLKEGKKILKNEQENNREKTCWTKYKSPESLLSMETVIKYQNICYAIVCTKHLTINFGCLLYSILISSIDLSDLRNNHFQDLNILHTIIHNPY